MGRGRVIELFVGMCLIILIFMRVLIVIEFDKMDSKVSGEVVSNLGKDQNDFDLMERHDYGNTNLDNVYTSHGEHQKESNWGTYADTFKVHVVNEGDGKYFIVKFYFQNFSGNEKIVDVRKYIFSDEKETFYYRDISRDINEYSSWKYQVIY